MPDISARDKARAEVKEIFDVDKPRSALEKRTLVDQLQAAAKRVDSDLTARFVLLNMARETAASIGDIDTAMTTVDALESEFAFDSFAARLLSIRQAGQSSNLNARRAVVVLASGKKLIDECVTAEDFVKAKKTVAVLLPIATTSGNKTAVKSLQDQMQMIEAAVAENQQVEKARSILQQSPDDPAANELLGRHAVIAKQDWVVALPLLAKAATPDIAAAAKSELNATTSKDKLEAAKAWLAITKASQDSRLNPVLQSHALTRFRDAATDLKGLSLIIAQKEISALEKAGVKVDPPVAPTQGTQSNDLKATMSQPSNQTPPKVVAAAEPVVRKPVTGARPIMDDIVDLRLADFESIDVLSPIDVQRHAIRPWTKNANLLRSTSGKFVRIRTPFVFPEQYDLAVKCKPITGKTNMVFTLPASTGHRFVLQLDAYRPEYRSSGLETIQGKKANENVTRFSGDLLQNGRMSSIQVSVRRTHIAVSVDGKSIIQYTGPQNVLYDRGVGTWHDKSDMAPLIGTYESVIEVHSMILSSFTDRLSGSPPRQPADPNALLFSRFDSVPIPSRIAIARKVFLDDLPEAAFSVGIGTLGKRGRKGHGHRNNDQIYLSKSRIQHAISMHPPGYGAAHVLYRLDGTYKTLTVQPGITELAPGKGKVKSKSKLQFSIYGDGKQLANVDNVQNAGVAGNLKVDVSGVKNLLLIVHCPAANGSAHAVWGNPVLEK